MGKRETSDAVRHFDHAKPRPADLGGWGTQDIADLYRIGEQLTQFGYPVAVNTGQSDEGDPWAVFERSGTGDVVVHIARIGAELVIVDVVRGRIHRGHDFRTLADRLLAEAKLTLPRIGESGNVVLHPRMVMMAFVAAALIVAKFAEPAGATTREATSRSGSDVPPALPGSEPGVRVAGREGVGGMPAGQTIGITSLSACFAAISAHLASAMAEAQTEAPTEGPDIAWLFGSETAVLAPPLELLNNSLADLLEEVGPKRESQPEGGTPEHPLVADLAGAAPLPTDAPPQDDGAPIISSGLPSSSEGASSAELATLMLGRLAQDLTESALPAGPRPAEETAQPATPAPEPMALAAFDRVVASVTVVGLSALLDLDLDGEADGAIVVRLSALQEDTLDTDGLTNDSPSSSSGAGKTAEHYLLISDLSDTIHLPENMVNIMVYMGGTVEVSGFTFGRDRLAFIEEAAALEWLASADIVGADVVLVGYDGGSVTLFGAAATLI